MIEITEDDVLDEQRMVRGDLYAHQKEIIESRHKKLLLPLGVGSGKTRIALLMAKGKTLVIAPKTQFLDKNWYREKDKLGLDIDLNVISKESFKKLQDKIPYYDTLILEEVHTLCGVTPNVQYRKGIAIPKTSQLFESVNDYIKKHNPEHIYALSGTPARNPMAVFALACFLGKEWNFYEYREAFYVKIPMPGREVWQPKKDKKTKERLANVILGLSKGFIGRLEDYFEVPEQKFEIIECPLSKEQTMAIDGLPMIYPDPLVLLQKTAQVENGFLIDSEYTKNFITSKIPEVLRQQEKFKKILVFCRYRIQINQLEAAAKSFGIKTFVLNGDAKDRESLFKGAEFSENCIFIAQSQISAGYELPSFRCTVFMSCSYSTVDHIQAQGRTLRANALASNTYIYLISGEIDKAIKKCLDNHDDFNEILYAERK